MEQTERELFKSLCSFKTSTFDKGLLEAATPAVLGHLFFNRMAGVAYGTLKKYGMLSKVNREFRSSLRDAFNQNVEKNNSYFECLKQLEEILSKSDCPYAMLKGAYLCKWYPDGFRTSNDIDLLVLPKDVTKVANALLDGGFKQGNVREDKFIAASRKDIIESKMMRGETVPFIKEVDLPGMKFLEVDINFSLDYKNGETYLLDEMLKNTVIENMENISVRTLRRDDFFVHLCAHLYKEATTLPWVEMMRDMTLYKYCDIYMILNDASKSDVNFLLERAKELGMEKVCGFAILQMSELFDFNNDYARSSAQEILKSDPNFIHIVMSPKENKKYIYTERDVNKRFFADSRKSLLREVEVE